MSVKIKDVTRDLTRDRGWYVVTLSWPIGEAFVYDNTNNPAQPPFASKYHIRADDALSAYRHMQEKLELWARLEAANAAENT